MKTYTFRIKWEDSYPPAVFGYSTVSSNPSSYRISVQSNSAKAAVTEATLKLNRKINYCSIFELIPTHD